MNKGLTLLTILSSAQSAASLYRSTGSDMLTSFPNYNNNVVGNLSLTSAAARALTVAASPANSAPHGGYECVRSG